MSLRSRAHLTTITLAPSPGPRTFWTSCRSQRVRDDRVELFRTEPPPRRRDPVSKRGGPPRRALRTGMYRTRSPPTRLSSLRRLRPMPRSRRRALRADEPVTLAGRQPQSGAVFFSGARSRAPKRGRVARTCTRGRSLCTAARAGSPIAHAFVSRETLTAESLRGRAGFVAGHGPSAHADACCFTRKLTGEDLLARKGGREESAFGRATSASEERRRLFHVKLSADDAHAEDSVSPGPADCTCASPGAKSASAAAAPSRQPEKFTRSERP